MLLCSNMKNRELFISLKNLMKLLFFMLFIPLCISYINIENTTEHKLYNEKISDTCSGFSYYMWADCTVIQRFSQWRTEGGIWVVQTPLPPKFRSFDKAEPNSQFRGKYTRNNLIRIWGSLICKLIGTPGFAALCLQLNLLNSLLKKILGWPPDSV
jgi:hypothetical protein